MRRFWQRSQLTEIFAKALKYRFEHCRIPKHTISQKSTWASHEPTPQIADTIMDMIKQRRKKQQEAKKLSRTIHTLRAIKTLSFETIWELHKKQQVWRTTTQGSNFILLFPQKTPLGTTNPFRETFEKLWCVCVLLQSGESSARKTPPVFQALCKKSFLETGPDHAREE